MTIYLVFLPERAFPITLWSGLDEAATELSKGISKALSEIL